MITHYDLFAGIGGFSLALEEVYPDATIKHVFCEWESFPTAVLRQHWPDGEFWGDISDLVADTKRQRRGGRGNGNTTRDYRPVQGTGSDSGFTIVTGGFPCQPFSHAGRRKGTADDRYQWPNMFAVIRNVKPKWVIAENVRGLVTWNEGLVLETVCSDLESEGYEVWPLIIPAVAVGAPHRRDRVWIIGCRVEGRTTTSSNNGLPAAETDGRKEHQPDDGSEVVSKSAAAGGADSSDVSAYVHGQRVGDGLGEVQGTDGEIPERHDHAEPGDSGKQYPDWSRNWQEVAFATCDDSVDDGLSRIVDGVPYSRAKWRQHSLKAYGNGIVHQVATQIIKSIRETTT